MSIAFRRTTPLDILAAGLLCLLGTSAAHAQVRGKFNAVTNIVKVRPGTSGPFANARINAPVAVGNNVRTGPQSSAEIKFTDNNSRIRIPQLSDIIIQTGQRQRDIGIAAGGLYGDYRGAGRFRSRSAVAAIGGTRFEFEETAKGARIRCWEGFVLAAPASAQLITGKIAQGGAAQLRSDDLIGATENWIGARVDFLSGPNSGQSRTVAAFDPVTGTVAWNPPLAAPTDTTTEFVLVQPSNGTYVVLRPNQETFVGVAPGSVPEKPYPTEPQTFAGGAEFPWMNDSFSGDQQTHLSGYFHEAFRSTTFYLDEAQNASTPWGDVAPGVQSGQRSSSPGSGSTSGNGLTGQVGNDSGNVVVVVGRAARQQTPGIFAEVPQIGGVGLTTTRSDSAFGYASASAVLGQTFVRVSGRIGNLNRAND